MRLFRLLALLTAAIVFLPTARGNPPKGDMEITTHSPKARALFLKGLAKMETLHVQEGLQSWRDATREDTGFALAHIYLCNFAQDPTEQVAEREKALATRKGAGAEEQLIIDWLANASKGQWIPAIQAMNEALARYKNDKHLAWTAGWWLVLTQNEPLRAIPLFQRIIRLDPKFADAYNELAYCYARTGNFDQAFVHIKRYTELLPNEANPQDSYAELSRMAGRFEDALTHYRASLKIDPSFIESQLGLGDTYALMGDEPRARAEYATAIKNGTTVQGALWSLQSAATYVREGKLVEADKAFQAAAQRAHDNDFVNLEAEAYRSMSLYQTDGAAAMDELRKAETVLEETHKVSQALVDAELASILRTRVERALRNGNADLAAETVAKLEKMADGTADANIQLAYHGAAGALLVSRGKYEEAISHLEEDNRNPFSMRQLVEAYGKTGAQERSERMAARLFGFNEPLIEQAVAVPAFRQTWAARVPKN